MFFKNNNNIKLFTKHSYHLIDPSPWPLLIFSSVFMLTVGLVTWMHSFKGGWTLLIIGLFLMIYIMSVWWRDVIREATFEEQHKVIVRRGLRFCMILFIVSEIMFFFAFFWAFFHSSLSPVFNIGGVWPPKSIVPVTLSEIPLSNTFLLVSSGATVTWGHYAIVTKAKKHITLLITIGLALLFIALQGLYYTDAPFINISDSTFGSCFYMTTGFHGFHVLVGTIVVCLIILKLYQANNRLFFFFVSGGFLLIFFVSFFGTIVWAVFSSLAIKPIISASQVLPAAMQHEVVGPTITIATTSSSMSINDCTAISSVASDTYDFPPYFSIKKEYVHNSLFMITVGLFFFFVFGGDAPNGGSSVVETAVSAGGGVCFQNLENKTWLLLHAAPDAYISIIGVSTALKIFEYAYAGRRNRNNIDLIDLRRASDFETAELRITPYNRGPEEVYTEAFNQFINSPDMPTIYNYFKQEVCQRRGDCTDTIWILFQPQCHTISIIAISALSQITELTTLKQVYKHLSVVRYQEQNFLRQVVFENRRGPDWLFNTMADLVMNTENDLPSVVEFLLMMST
jgi:cytochrome c oxidase subunit 3